MKKRLSKLPIFIALIKDVTLGTFYYGVWFKKSKITALPLRKKFDEL